MKVKKKKQMERLNLIPILDAIFIFIFFLLMSAQFIDIHQIGTDAPITSEINPEKDDKKPLNLTLIVSKENITIKTGLDEKIEGKFSFEELVKFNEKLVELKQNHPQEKTAIFKPDARVNYQDIIKIIDYTKIVKKENLLVTSIDEKGIKTQTSALFDQIVFETQD